MSSGGANEWTLLREQFQALARDNIEDIFDDQFRKRFSELINRLADRESLKSVALSDSNLVEHLSKYTARRNSPKNRRRNRVPLDQDQS